MDQQNPSFKRLLNKMPHRMLTLSGVIIMSFLLTASMAQQTAPQAGGAGNEYKGVVLEKNVDLPRNSRTLPATIEINESVSIKPFTRELFGYNFDWNTMQSLMVEAGSGGMDPKIASLLSGLRSPLNRMSGSESQTFHWKETLGPLQERKEQVLYEGAVPTKIKFGIVEWIQLMQSIDSKAAFVWCVNLATEQPTDHADLVEFLTGDPKRDANGGVNWAQRRVDLGIKNPVRVAIWEIGNEMDWGKDRMSVEQYIEAARKAIQAIRFVDPMAKIAVLSKTAPWEPGGEKTWYHWHQAVLKALGTQIDYVVFHCYYDGHTVAHLDTFIRKIQSDIVAITGSARIKLFFSEHARWPEQPKEGGPEAWRKEWFRTHSLDGCLSTARFLVRSLNEPERVAATYHSFSSGPWGLVYRDQAGRVYSTGIADMFRIMEEIEGDTVVQCHVNGPLTDVTKNTMNFTAAAVQRRTGIDLVIVNRGPKREAAILTRDEYRLKGSRVLTGPDIDSYNTADGKPITLQTVPIDKGAGALNAYPIPAYSIVLLHLERVAKRDGTIP